MKASFFTAKVLGAVIVDIARIEEAVKQHRDLHGRYLAIRHAKIADDPMWDSSSHQKSTSYSEVLESLIKKKNLLEGTDQEKISISENEYDEIFTQEYPLLHTEDFVKHIEAIEGKLEKTKRS